VPCPYIWRYNFVPHLNGNRYTHYSLLITYYLLLITYYSDACYTKFPDTQVIPLTQETNITTITNVKRADALDALRGFAILAMVLSGTIRYKILPTWMYHAQEPPPTHAFNAQIAGLTWVDVVFPLFLFAMGAAIPLALSRRIAQGWSIYRVILYILKRGFMLGAFAIILQHLRPYTINKNPTSATWYLAMLGFVLLFLIFSNWSILGRWRKYGVWLNLAGFIATIALISQLQYGGKGFLLERSDPILMVLANMAIFGSLAWLFTLSNLLLRLGFLGYLIAFQLSASTDGWVKSLWTASSVPILGYNLNFSWIFQFYYWKYLFIVIPGTIVGELILNWLQKSNQSVEISKNQQTFGSRYSQRLWLIILSMLMICLVLLVGLQGRWVWQATIVSSAICAASWLLFAQPENDIDNLLKQFYQWGVYWLLLGLFFEPFPGGIHKDPSTYSYYFVTSAIAIFLLIIFTIILDIFKQKKWLQLLIDNGQNPMIAYVAFANLLWPVLQLTGLEDWIIVNTTTPVMGVIKGIATTLLIALFTSLCTRLRLFWKT
jgi:predicted acyltransferase